MTNILLSEPSATMVDELNSDDPIFSPSLFWADLNAKNVMMLGREGLPNFKRTVSQNYFNWMIDNPLHPYFAHIQSKCREAGLLYELPTTLSEMSRLHLTTMPDEVLVSDDQREGYRRYASFIWQLMTDLDKRGLHRNLAEPVVGNPFPLLLGEKRISQDLANSILECNAVADLCDGIDRPIVAELGAGYGRLAYVFAKTMPGLYCIFDIPPALTVAQWYISQTLGADAVFPFRPFKNFEEIKAELLQAKVAFFTANQIARFPARFFDLTLSISTLPEMRKEQALFYVSEFKRLSRRSIFLKQWKTWRNPMDGTDLMLADYQIGGPWAAVVEGDDPIIPDFVSVAWSREPFFQRAARRISRRLNKVRAR